MKGQVDGLGGWSCVESGLEPRMHMIADLSSEKFNLHLSQTCSVEPYEFPASHQDVRMPDLLYIMDCNAAHACTAVRTAFDSSGETGAMFSLRRTRSSYALNSSPTHSSGHTGLGRSCD